MTRERRVDGSSVDGDGDGNAGIPGRCRHRRRREEGTEVGI